MDTSSAIFDSCSSSVSDQSNGSPRELWVSCCDGLGSVGAFEGVRCGVYGVIGSSSVLLNAGFLVGVSGSVRELFRTALASRGLASSSQRKKPQRLGCIC